MQMEQPQLQELATPFPDSLVKDAPAGRFGSYVAHSTVTERLLSIVGPFTYEVVDIIRGDAPQIVGKSTKNHKYTKDNPKYPGREDAIVGCLARLEVMVDGGVYEITEVGDASDPAMNHDGANLKNASSDAIKRCAMRLGLGLHLWSQEDYFLDLQLASANKDDETEEGLDADAVADIFDGEVVDNEGKTE